MIGGFIGNPIGGIVVVDAVDPIFVNVDLTAAGSSTLAFKPSSLWDSSVTANGAALMGLKASSLWDSLLASSGIGAVAWGSNPAFDGTLQVASSSDTAFIADAVTGIRLTSNGIATVALRASSLWDRAFAGAGAASTNLISEVNAVFASSGQAGVNLRANALSDALLAATGTALVDLDLEAVTGALFSIQGTGLFDVRGNSLGSVRLTVEGIAAASFVGELVSWQPSPGADGNWIPEGPAGDGWVPENAQGGAWTQ